MSCNNAFDENDKKVPGNPDPISFFSFYFYQFAW